MDTDRILEIVLREMTAYGQGYRLDWSDFDGRTLRDQLNRIRDWAIRAKTDPNIFEYKAGSIFLENSQ